MPGPGRTAAERAFAAALALALTTGCRRARSPLPPRTDAADHAFLDTATGEPPRGTDAAFVGPPNPWGDGALPPSTASGPEAAATLGTLNAVRATIGLWRVERDALAYCPTLGDLARTPAASFDRASMARDAWGTPLEIECQGSRVRVRSLGPDRARETGDDLLVQ